MEGRRFKVGNPVRLKSRPRSLYKVTWVNDEEAYLRRCYNCVNYPLAKSTEHRIIRHDDPDAELVVDYCYTLDLK